MTLFELQSKTYSEYLNVYAVWRETDKHYSINCLQDRNYYTFADDMIVYLMNVKTAETEIDKYIKRMLRTHCKNNKQGYFEMIISTLLMTNIFNKIGLSDLSNLCADWHQKLFFDEDTIKKYIKIEEIEDMWRLR